MVWFEFVFIPNEGRSRARRRISHIKPVMQVLLAASPNTQTMTMGVRDTRLSFGETEELKKLVERLALARCRLQY